MDFGDSFLGILLGLGLSVACGFRVFIPLLVTGIAAKTGNLELAEGFTWLGEWPALIAFSVAAVTESTLYYLPIPGLGSLVDIVDAPLVLIAGTVLSASQVFTDMDPLLQWSLAAIAGGGSAEVLHLGTAGLRAPTAGYNPLLSVEEDAGAVTTPILAIKFLHMIPPEFIVLLLLVLLVVAVFAIKFAINRLRAIRNRLIAIREWILKRRPAETTHSL